MLPAGASMGAGGAGGADAGGAVDVCAGAGLGVEAGLGRPTFFRGCWASGNTNAPFWPHPRFPVSATSRNKDAILIRTV